MTENIYQFLNNTKNTNLTFINTFNALSVIKIKEFLEYILDLRSIYSKDNQGVQYIPISDPYTKHPDYVINPRQRIWFDLPILRNPIWQSFLILPKKYDTYIVDAINFMEKHKDTDNFVGFYDFEIDKLKRNLTILKENRFVDNDAKNHRKNFIEFFKQYDAKKNISFSKAFPEFENFKEELCL